MTPSPRFKGIDTLAPFSFVLSGMFTVVHKDFAVPSKADMPQPPK